MNHPTGIESDEFSSRTGPFDTTDASDRNQPPTPAAAAQPSQQPPVDPAAPSGPNVRTVVHGLILLALAVAILIGFLSPDPNWTLMTPLLFAGLGVAVIAVAGATALLRHRSQQ